MMHSRRLYVTLLVWLVAGCWLVRCVYRSIQIGLHCSFDVCTCWFAMTKLPSSSANRTKESNVRICACATEPATSKTIYSQLQKFQLDRNGKKTTTKKRHRVRLLCFCFSVGCFFFVSSLLLVCRPFQTECALFLRCSIGHLLFAFICCSLLTT